jgi:hypothetical protein
METKSAKQMAEVYGLKSAHAFNTILFRCGLLVETGKGGHALAAHLRGRGYVASADVPYFLANGFKVYKKIPVWTEAGQAYIRKTLLRYGIVPVSEQKDLFNN